MKNGTRLYINITNHCSVNCPFCCMYSGKEKKTFMSFDIFKSIIDSCKGEFELQLEGGEPTLHPQMYLFIEYAISTTRCSKIIILSNGFNPDATPYTIDTVNRFNDNIKRLISIVNAYSIDIEVKISINYHLLRVIPNAFSDYNKLIFATQYIPGFDIIFNVRARDEKEKEEFEVNLKKYGLFDRSNIYFFQSYGKLSASAKYDKPVIVQNINNWRLYACDGEGFEQDLIARSEHEKVLK